MTREEKIKKIDNYCESIDLYDCDSMCKIKSIVDCWNKNFEELTDEELDACLEIINGKSVFSNKKTFKGTLIIEPAIKDSGNRREFETGAVRDMQEGKGRMDLLPWAAILEVSKHCEAGAKKYGEHNVDKGIPTNSLCDSAARHLAKYLDGQKDENHLLAAAWNLLWCIEMTIKKPEMVNTPFEINNSK